MPFNIVAKTNQNTVISEYIPVKARSNSYQTEQELEVEFIRLLCNQGYSYIDIKSEADLVSNLRSSMERLNDTVFSDKEWNSLFSEIIANPNDGTIEKTRKIQEDFVQTIKRDDGTSKNIKLIDKSCVHNNTLQVINQYAVDKKQGAKYNNRYDVTVLVNGLPLVHIELKRRGVALREAFNQIDRYSKDSFWAGSGLYDYVQIFVISNGTNTKYYSNTTRYNAGKNKGSDPSNRGFEFTSFWADANNTILPDLVDFTKTFFAKHTILNILTRYCIFTSENVLMVMRPYQITGTERILNRIHIAKNYKQYGTIQGGGYIWHATGSGKTLTSFKTARIASSLLFVDKVLFVVDRKDLDYQTMKEYDRFEKNAANSNTSTAILRKQLEDDRVRIIITTIQKLSRFVKRNKSHSIYNKHVVMIFDECHRSQFGDMHKVIAKSFNKYYLFGFTGTPIFAVNATSQGRALASTTEQVFGEQLHAYTIVDAINDNNILPFKIDYVKTVGVNTETPDEMVKDIDRERAMLAPERINLVSRYIVDHFSQKTYRGKNSSSKHNNSNGFNSLFAVASIEMAKLYYKELQGLIKSGESDLNVAIIYSYNPNENTAGGILGEENPDDASLLDASSRDFLDAAIQDYNKIFLTDFDTSSEKFQNYYKDISMRVKNKEIDILIVVNMFLTGFDAATVNTLWIDKNVRDHGLIQAFSRTNRIFTPVKAFGNIVCFRNLKNRVDEAISLFGNKNAGGIVIINSFSDYYNGYTAQGGIYNRGYTDMVKQLKSEFPLSDERITGEITQKSFIALFGSILRMRNILVSFDEFEGKDVIAERDMQDYLGRYQDLRDTWLAKDNDEKADIIDDVVFETELIEQIDINIDYILTMVKKYYDSNCEDKEVLLSIERSVSSSPSLRSKKGLINSFIEDVSGHLDVPMQWNKFTEEQKEKDIALLVDEEKINNVKARLFIRNALRTGIVNTAGTEISDLLPPVSRFGGEERYSIKQRVTNKIIQIFEKYIEY